MDERKLEVFLTALHTGSFNKAAQELNCTQSAVTQMMNSLEDELDCRLLERTYSGIRLTESGAKLYPYLEKAYSSLTELRKNAESLSTEQIITLRIGSFSSISNTWLPSLMQEYQKIHPEITFSLRIGTDSLSDWLKNDEIDVALGDEMRCQGGVFTPLKEDIYYAVLPDFYVDAKRDSISQKELVKFPFIMAPLNGLEFYLSESPENIITVDCDDDSTLLTMVSLGLGVSAIPEMSLKNINKNICILDLYPQTARTIGATCRPSASKHVQNFVSFIEKRLR